MIKLIIGVEGTNLLCRRIPNNVGGYSPLQEVKLYPHPSVWAGVTSFQIREYVKRANSNFTVKKLSIYYLNRAIKVSIASAKSCR